MIQADFAEDLSKDLELEILFSNYIDHPLEEQIIRVDFGDRLSDDIIELIKIEDETRTLWS